MTILNRDRESLSQQLEQVKAVLEASREREEAQSRELEEKLEQLHPSVFFSHELCARYFTYMSRESGAHFVLFDDGATLRRKLEAAQSLSIRTVLAPWQEIADVTVTLGLYPVERTRTGQVLR